MTAGSLCPHGQKITTPRGSDNPCGKQVWRCDCCDRTVAKNLAREGGGGCPKCPGATVAPSTCRLTVKPGSPTCYRHGSNAPQVVAAASRRLQAVEATEQLRQLGVSLETTPIAALEAMLFEAAGNVAVLRELVGSLPLEAGRLGNSDRGLAPTDGIYGHTYHQSGIPTGEAKPHVIVVMYNEERDRLAKLAEICVKLGLDRRRVELAEADARELFAGVMKAITAAGLTDQQAEVFRRELANQLRRTRPAPIAS